MQSFQSTGYEDVSLSALSISDYPYFDQTVRELMDQLQENSVSLSVPSLRPRGLTSEVAENIIKVRKTGFTLVPEAGTERLRCVINKDMHDNDIWDAVDNAFSQGWRLLKLYFMVGLPDETEENILKSIELCKKIAPDWTLVSVFCPYPGTRIYENLVAQGRLDPRFYEWLETDTFYSHVQTFDAIGISAKRLEYYYKHFVELASK